MTNRVLVMMEVPEDQEVEELLDIDNLDASVVYQRDLVELDPRQREAITDLLMGFNLPVDMMSAANNMLLASFVNQNATIGHMGSDNRKVSLERARAAIEEMLKEL